MNPYQPPAAGNSSPPPPDESCTIIYRVSRVTLILYLAAFWVALPQLTAKIHQSWFPPLVSLLGIGFLIRMLFGPLLKFRSHPLVRSGQARAIGYSSRGPLRSRGRKSILILTPSHLILSDSRADHEARYDLRRISAGPYYDFHDHRLAFHNESGELVTLYVENFRLWLDALARVKKALTSTPLAPAL